MNGKSEVADAPAFAGSAQSVLTDRAVIAIAVAAVAIHLATAGGYGYFRDELYYIACSDHLAFGYVDHPPLSILILAVQRHLFGDSLYALRLFPALAAGVLVLISAALAAELGADSFGRALTGLCILATPVFLATQNFYSMNAFEPIFWTAGAYTIVRLIKSGDQRLWVVFGAIAGLGLENKHSMLFLCFGLGVGIVLTDWRRFLKSKWLWIGAAVALALFLPNLIWEANNHWATLEFMRNAQRDKNYHSSIVEFVVSQIIVIGPFNFPVWLAGLYFYLFDANGRRYRAFGFAFLAVAALMTIQGAKAYYLSPIYPIMLAGGAVLIGDFCRARDLRWPKRTLVGALAVSLVVFALGVMPILPPAALVKVQGRMTPKAHSVLEGERNEYKGLPQTLADRFGWPEMAAAIAQVYRSLPEGERARCAIVASNYGEAGAIDFFGRKLGLPPASSPHNNYWIWGEHPPDSEVVIVVGSSEEDLRRVFAQVERAAVFKCEYCMPYESNLPIYVCRGLKVPGAWSRAKRFI